MDSITHAVGGLLVASIAARRKVKFYPVLLAGALEIISKLKNLARESNRALPARWIFS